MDGVRLGISPGGGICGRCIGVGAVLAAKGGLDSIPNEWLNKTLAKEEMVKYADILKKFWTSIFNIFLKNVLPVEEIELLSFLWFC